MSGFPEWLPAGRIVEQRITDRLRATFELHGFASLRTRSVEPVTVLLGKGETDKEIYGLRRLADSDDDGVTGSAGSDLGLHFDLTVPLARYVVENAGVLDFPFRRYQIQQVWRGERPQEGRYREFTQADIDVIGDGELSFHHEVEVALVAAEALSALPMPPVRLRVSNRKVAEGFYRGLGLEDVAAVLRVVDKIDKVGPERVTAELQELVGATASQAQRCLDFAAIRSEPGAAGLDVTARVSAIGVQHPQLDEGLGELASLIEAAESTVPGVMSADLSIARGLDYYTGTVYETHLLGHESLGSICSGGRYDELARKGNRSFPGVGISVGVTRLVGALLGRDLVRASRSVPSCVLVAVTDEQGRTASTRVATALRRRGVAAEVAPSAAKFGKQIRYADRRGVPYVWFPDETGTGGEVKDIRTGEQSAADPAAWLPAQQDLTPEVQISDSGQSTGQTPVRASEEDK